MTAPTVSANIDRLDDDVAVLDADGRAVTVPRAWLPADAHEGDAIEITVAKRAHNSVAASVQSRLDALTGRKR